MLLFISFSFNFIFFEDLKSQDNKVLAALVNTSNAESIIQSIKEMAPVLKLSSRSIIWNDRLGVKYIRDGSSGVWSSSCVNINITCLMAESRKPVPVCVSLFLSLNTRSEFDCKYLYLNKWHLLKDWTFHTKQTKLKHENIFRGLNTNSWQPLI